MSREAFWKAICAEPDDDMPRLVFADWLDERGDPASAARAEFIRAQIELARLEPWTERAVELTVRERVLLREYQKEWLAELPAWANRSQASFARGFAHSQRFIGAKFAERAASMAADTVVQDVGLVEGQNPAAVRAAGAIPQLARVRALECGVEEVLSSPHLTGLREWRLAENWIPPPSATPLARLLNLPAVRAVSRLALQIGLGNAGAAEEKLRALADSPLTNLRQLRLRVYAFPPVQVAAVLHSPACDRLASYSGYLDEGVFGSLHPTREIPTLRSVDFSVNGREQDWLAWGCAAPLLRHAVALQLDGLTDRGFRLLAESELAGRLRVLTLPMSRVEPATLHDLAGRFPNLLALTLDVPHWSGGNLRELARVTGLANVRHLTLQGWSGAVSKMLAGLAASANWPNLRAVSLPASRAKLKGLAAKYANRFAVLGA